MLGNLFLLHDSFPWGPNSHLDTVGLLEGFLCFGTKVPAGRASQAPSIGPSMPSLKRSAVCASCVQSCRDSVWGQGPGSHSQGGVSVASFSSVPKSGQVGLQRMGALGQ